MECPSKSGTGPELFLAYAAGTLPDQLRLTLEHHFGVCEECGAIAAAQQQVWLALDKWDPQMISPDFDSKVYARIAAEPQHPWYRKLLQADRFYRPALPLATACALILAGFLLRDDAGSPASQPPAGIQKQVDIEQVERALDDIEMLDHMGVAVPDTIRKAATEPI